MAVKFYKRFPGDITVKTGHLSMSEFGAYDRLLDHYYATETPIPAARAYGICRALTKQDREAVDRVLAEFFQLTEAGWTQGRADEVIAEALPRIQAARENGKRGGRPKKTQQEPTGFTEETQQEPRAKASQSQNQISSSPSVQKKGARRAVDRPDDVSEAVWIDFQAVRKAKKAAMSDTALAGIRREADKAGMTLQQALETCCQRGWAGFEASWLKQTAVVKPFNRQLAVEEENRRVGEQWLREMEARDAQQ